MRNSVLCPLISQLVIHSFNSLQRGSFCQQHLSRNIRFWISPRPQMSQKALAKGSVCPPIKKDTLRLYGMRFCPYVKRVRLVLANKNITYETVNINLSDKPEWYLKRFPEGKVPVLEQNGKTVFESLIIADYVDDFYPNAKLHPEDPYQKATDKCLISKFSKASDNWGRAIYKPEEAKEAIQEVMSCLEVFEQELTSRRSTFFGGDKPMMLDLMIWPWFEMFLVGESLLGQGFSFDDLLPNARFPNLRKWVKSMEAYPSVKELLDIENQKKFAESMRAGNRNFDVGL